MSGFTFMEMTIKISLLAKISILVLYLINIQFWGGFGVINLSFLFQVRCAALLVLGSHDSPSLEHD